MVNYVGMSGGGGVYEVPRDTSGLQNLQLLQQIAGQIGQAGAAYRKQSQEQAQAQALIDAFGGTAPQPGAPAASGVGPPQPPTPGTPGLLPNVPPEVIQALAMGGDTGALLDLYNAQTAPGEGFTLNPGDMRFDASGRMVATAPAGVDPPKTRDILIGNERVFQQFDPATGQYVEVGRGPAFAPPTSITVNAEKPIEGSAAAPLITLPGVIAETPQVENYLFPNGEFDRTRAGSLIVPYLREAVGAGGIYASIRAAVQAKLRRESGATITESEVDEQMSVYLPSPLDSDAAARSKWERFKREVLGTLETSARGRGEVPAAPDVPPVAGGDTLVDDLSPTPAAPATEDYGEGEIVRNPETGERLILRGGQWVPWNG